MTRKPARDVAEAVQLCIDRFYYNANPAFSVEQTLDTLTRCGWPPHDVGRVERICRKVLDVPVAAEHSKAA